jgi:glycosyltransferase involved in cell wall biosynthesis
MPGCREIVEDQVNGLLVPPKNVEKLTSALAKLIESPELRKKMGQLGRNKVKRDFSEQKVIAETMTLYQELLK